MDKQNPAPAPMLLGCTPALNVCASWDTSWVMGVWGHEHTSTSPCKGTRARARCHYDVLPSHRDHRIQPGRWECPIRAQARTSQTHQAGFGAGGPVSPLQTGCLAPRVLKVPRRPLASRYSAPFLGLTHFPTGPHGPTFP
jgi:hypothetical protein